MKTKAITEQDVQSVADSIGITVTSKEIEKVLNIYDFYLEQEPGVIWYLIVEDCIYNIKSRTLVCSNCGGLNVQVKYWVDANTHELMGDCDDDDASDTWCDDCEDHTGLIFAEEWGIENTTP